jgi:hypothetical protein
MELGHELGYNAYIYTELEKEEGPSRMMDRSLVKKTVARSSDGQMVVQKQRTGF